MIITIAVICLLVLAIPLAYFYTYSQGEKVIKKVDNLIASNEKSLIFIGRPTCSYCNLLQPSLDRLAQDYNFEYAYVNIDELNDSQYERVVKKFGQDPNTFGTPYLAVVESGKKVGEQKGYVEEEVLFNFLQEKGIIANDVTYVEEESNLNKINYQEYKELLNKGEKAILVIARTGCGACTAAKPDLEAIVAEYNIQINWFDLIKINSNEEGEKFLDSLDYYRNNEWGTPLTLIIENKKVVDAFNGYYNKQAYVDFFRTNGFIK